MEETGLCCWLHAVLHVCYCDGLLPYPLPTRGGSGEANIEVCRYFGSSPRAVGPHVCAGAGVLGAGLGWYHGPHCGVPEWQDERPAWANSDHGNENSRLP